MIFVHYEKMFLEILLVQIKINKRDIKINIL
jgi:hypothetical protein